VNVYFWENVTKLTDNYHSSGGVVIVAASLEAARDMLRDYHIRDTYSELVGACSAYVDEPDRVIPVGETEKPELFVFPDSGCC
jgi:hypothetical protein